MRVNKKCSRMSSGTTGTSTSASAASKRAELLKKNRPISGRQTRATVHGQSSSSGTTAPKSKTDTQSDRRAEDSEEDLSLKVKRLESMIVRLQNKIEEILDGLLCHRSERIAARAKLNEILDREEEARLSVVEQLQSCLNPTVGDGSEDSASNRPQSQYAEGRLTWQKVNKIPIPIAERNQRATTKRIPHENISIDPDPEIQDTMFANVDIDIKLEPGNDNDHGRGVLAEDQSDQWLNEELDMDVDDDEDDADWPAPSAPRIVVVKKGPSQVAKAGSTSRKGKAPNYSNYNFTRRNSFPNKEEADHHVRSEGVWEQRRSMTTLNGTKIHYNCKTCSSCPMRMYIFYERPDAEVHQYVSQDDHDHTQQPEPDQLETSAARPASDMQFVTSGKGNELAVVDGYVFRKNSGNTKTGAAYYACTQRKSLQCRARLVLYPNGTFLLSQDHTNHMPNPAKVEAYKLRASVKRMATELEPAEVVSQVENMLLLTNDQGQDVGSMLGNKDLLRRTIRRVQQIQKKRKPIPCVETGSSIIGNQNPGEGFTTEVK